MLTLPARLRSRSHRVICRTSSQLRDALSPHLAPSSPSPWSSAHPGMVGVSRVWARQCGCLGVLAVPVLGAASRSRRLVGPFSSSYDFRDTSGPKAIRDHHWLAPYVQRSICRPTKQCPWRLGSKKRKRADVFADNHQWAALVPRAGTVILKIELLSGATASAPVSVAG